MMHLLGGCQLASAFTFLAEWVRLDEFISHALPCTTISLVGFRLALIMVVMMIHFLLMLCTVKAVSQLGAAGMLARALGFPWHGFTSVSGHEKSPGGLLPRGCSRFCFPDYILPQRTT